MHRRTLHRSVTTHWPQPGLHVAGYLHASGELVAARRPEIEAALGREARRAHHDSPAASIVATDSDGSGGLLVATTTEHLAHRLGQALVNVFGGDLHHGFGHQNRIAFVWWRGR